ncbi:MAG: hypothetical protein ACRDVM_05625, partial [Acidimicrobiia bacterium]
ASITTGDGSRPVDLPEDGWPGFGHWPLVVGMPLEAGHLRPFTRFADSTGTTDAQVTLVSAGWEEVRLDQQLARLWRVDQYARSALEASFWLDGDHRIVRVDWKGALSSLVPGPEEAVEGLPDEVLDFLDA